MSPIKPADERRKYPYTVETKRIVIRGDSIYELIDRSVHISPIRETKSFQSSYLGKIEE